MLDQHQRLTRAVAPDRDRDREVERHVAALTAWRRRSPEEQWFALGADEAPFAPSVEPARGRARVGLLCPCLGLGGAEAWQLALARAVDPAAVSWRGAVVTEGRGAVTPASLGPLAARMPVGFGLSAARALAEQVDVLVSWAVLDYDRLFRGLPRPPRLALACHFPGELPWTDGEARLLARADRLVAVSELAVDSLPAAFRREALVVWNAVDADRLVPTASRAATRAGWGVPASAPVAGYLGRLSPEKDPAAMLRLAAELPSPWHVVLVGDGREGPALAAEVDRLGLDRVRLVPGTGRVGDALASFDSLVVPSRFESFGLTLAEGLWAGVPVVATRSGLARIVPGLVREVPVGASGVELAAAVRLDHEGDHGVARLRAERARSFARDRLGLGRFGAAWSRILLDLAPEPHTTPIEEAPWRPSLLPA